MKKGPIVRIERPDPFRPQADPLADAIELIPAEELAMLREDRPAFKQNERRKARKLAGTALALLFSGSTLYAADTTAAPKPRSKPSAQITVKVYPDKFQGKKERLILRPVSTPGHCTAWIAADEDALWISALDSCRALLRKGGAK
jgi:hypothetical protein